MPDLHDLLAAEAERQRPHAIPPFDRLTARARRRQLTGYAAAVALTAGLAATIVSFAVSGPDTAINQPPAGQPRPAPTAGTVALVSTGACAGLTVTASLPPSGTQRPISPGAQDNRVSMPGSSVMYLNATGPCVDQLHIHVTSPLLQTVGAKPDAAFNSDRANVVYSHDNGPGTGTVDLVLSCQPSQDCPAHDPLATITVAVGGLTRPPPAQTPQSTP